MLGVMNRRVKLRSIGRAAYDKCCIPLASGCTEVLCCCCLYWAFFRAASEDDLLTREVFVKHSELKMRCYRLDMRKSEKDTKSLQT